MYGINCFASLNALGEIFLPNERWDMMCDIFIWDASNEWDSERAAITRLPGTCEAVNFRNKPPKFQERRGQFILTNQIEETWTSNIKRKNLKKKNKLIPINSNEVDAKSSPIFFLNYYFSMKLTFFKRTYPSIRQPPADGAGLLTLPVPLLDLSSKASFCDPAGRGATKSSIVCEKCQRSASTVVRFMCN